MAKVRSGWNSDYAHKKFDVELDEADLARILRPLGIDPEQITVREAEELLYSEAEEYAKLTLGRFDPTNKESLVPQIRKHRAEKKALLERIQERLAGERGD